MLNLQTDMRKIREKQKERDLTNTIRALSNRTYMLNSKIDYLYQEVGRVYRGIKGMNEFLHTHTHTGGRR